MDIKRESIDLTKLFGKDRAQEDKNLGHYFIKTRQYEEIKRGDKELVLGRKGAGKSALFSIIAKETCESQKSILVKISFDGEDFVYIENWLHKHKFCESLDDDFKYSLAWKNFIINEIIYTALLNVEFVDSSLKKKLIQEGVIDNSLWKRFAIAVLNVFKEGRLQSPLGELRLDFTNITSLSLQDKEKIKEAIVNLMENNTFVVVIDNLDEPWKNNEEMNSWLRGLIFSIRQLKREFNNLKIVAFLRTDIFDIISKGSDLFDSKSEITTISWDDNNFFSLNQLVAARISYYLGKPFPVALEDIREYWRMFYPTNLYYNGKTRSLNDYIIARTFRRPRELLQFCRLIVECGKKTYLPIEENAIAYAETQYSNWKLIDLAGEYSKTCKNIDKCILSFAGAQKKWDWNCDSLITHIDKIDTEDRIHDATTDRVYSTREIIRFLYQIGFFRKVIRGTGKRTKYRMYYEDNTINYNASIFDIHPAFRKKFTNS